MIQFLLAEHGRKLGYQLDDAVGFLPHSWDPTDPRDAITQHDSRPNPGGPWSKAMLKGWELTHATGALKYPGDRPMLPIALAELPLTCQTIYVYPGAWVCIKSPDDSFAVDRRD